MTAMAGLFLVMLTGCPPVYDPEVKLPLPPPISVEQQMSAINQRAMRFVSLRLSGDVKLSWQQDNKKRSENAEGTLWIQRAMARSVDGLPAMTNAALFVTKLGQPAVEIGVNRDTHWLAFRGDMNEAYVGSAHSNQDAALRADLLVDLLGITGVRNNPPATMSVSDQSGVNTIYEWSRIERQDTHGMMQTMRVVTREIVISRRTGNILEVRLYRTDGTLIAESKLSDYDDVMQAREDDDPIVSGLRLPTRAIIRYPSRKAVLELKLSRLIIPLRIKPDTFKMPDFAKQGLNVLPWEKE